MNDSPLASRFSLGRKPQLFVYFLAAIFVCGCTQKTQKPDEPPQQDDQKANTRAALSKAAEYLVGQQSADDGNWYSQTSGVFNESSESPAPTALAVYALAHLPADMRQEHEPKLRAALDRLRSQITEKGFVGNVHGGAHYPTYVTGMVLAAYHRLGWELPEEDEHAMISYLESAQLSQSRGWRPEDRHFGGWDLLGDQMVERQSDGPGTNVSVTSFALEGLAPAIEKALSDAEPSDAQFEMEVPNFALYWLTRLQEASTGGGFAFGPDPFSNKAGFEKPTDGGNDQKQNSEAAEPPKLRSYGSATCDGLRSFAYLKVDADEKQVQDAERWLTSNDVIDRVPGFGDAAGKDETAGQDEAAGKDWRQSLYYYYTMSLAKVYRLYPRVGTPARRSRLANHLVKLQRPDGSWLNPAAGMREDDPLIATSFALIALAELSAE